MRLEVPPAVSLDARFLVAGALDEEEALDEGALDEESLDEEGFGSDLSSRRSFATSNAIALTSRV